MDISFLHSGFEPILRTLIVGTLGYIALLVCLRTSGKRTLAKLNAFDFVVTVALGSTLATILLSQSVSLTNGVAAMVLLIALQYLVTWTSVRSPRIAGLMRSEPSLLMRDGRILPGALQQERVTENELMTQIRLSDTPDPDRVAAVVLESDGSFSVIPKSVDQFARAGLPT